MSLKKVSSTYWTFTIIAILFTAVVSYIIGYSVASYTVVKTSNLSTDDIDVSGEIMDEQIIKGLYFENINSDNTNAIQASPTAIYTFTGYIREINDDSISIEHSDASTDWEDTLSFTITSDSNYVELKLSTDENNLPISIENPITINDLSVGDIVTAYTNENILKNESRTINKIQLIKKVNNIIE